MLHPQKIDLVVKNASELLTCKEDAPDIIGVIKNGWVAISRGVISAVGTKEAIERLIEPDTKVIDATGKVLAPGFVDCHTHVVFGGTRVDEYFANIENISDEGKRRRGIKTGIIATLDQTRRLSLEGLYEESAARVKNMLLSGTTTVESKSGYGLDRETELKQLKVNKLLEERLPVSIVSTFLGAHGWPHECNKREYIHFLLDEMIPIVGNEKLAEFCDVWCDEGHYSAEESKTILEAGQKYGMKAKIHTGAYSYVGGADVAVQVAATSADHLNYTPQKALGKLSDGSVTGVVLPGIDFAVKHPRPFDPAPMLDMGLDLALATNCCPGCWCTSMPFIIILACRNHGMSVARAIRGATISAAKAVAKDKKIGSIEPDKVADLQLWNLARHDDIAYHFTSNPINTVIKQGKVVVSNSMFVN